MTDSEFHENPDEHLAERLESISDEEAEKRATALEAGLSSYDLEDEDRALLDAYGFEFEAEETRGADPVLAVVGRPNVGKSTLVNRILGRREAVVEDVPGVTRDRVSYRAEWNTKEFTLVDTGGWDSDSKGMASRIAIQSEVAVDMADAVVLVVDATTGPTATDEMVVKMLRRKKKPVILAANKVDDERGELMAAELWGLGLGQPFTVSGLHGRGVADLLDEVLTILPEVSAVETRIEEGGPRRIALVGRPNVGKSSCSTSSSVPTVCSWTTSPAPPATRSTNSSSSVTSSGVSWTPPESVVVLTRPAVLTSMLRCAPRPLWNARSWLWSSLRSRSP